MTEAEWLTATNPSSMLDFLRQKASDRKLILFCLYWCPLYGMERANGDPGYDTAMRWAEVGDNWQALKSAWRDPVYEHELSMPERPGDWASSLTDPAMRNQFATPPTSQAPLLLRCIFGNPFRPASVDPRWLTSDVLAVSRGIYDDKAFDRLPILADALMDAECDNEDILNHCRSDGPHVRGCWVVDALLGKS